MANPLRSLIRAFQSEPEKPKTIYSKTGGTNRVSFTDKVKEDDAKFRAVYEQGGIVAEGVDCYPLFVFTNGYRLEGGSPEEQKFVQEMLDTLPLEEVGSQWIRDSLVLRRGLGEILASKDRSVSVSTVVYRKPEMFKEIRDDYNTLLGYEQYASDSGSTLRRKIADIPPERMFRLDLDLPLIKRAYREIERDWDIADATAKAIIRHGYPRYLVKVGLPGEVIDDNTISTIGTAFENLKAQHEMATGPGVEIQNIDQGGIPNVKQYGEWAIERLCSAIGVPEEMLGLGRGSTEASANVRLQAFYDKIGTIQKKFARAVNIQLIDRLLGKPGVVRLVFNDVSPIDDKMRAEVVQTLTSNALDPWYLITQDEARAMLDMKPREDEYQPPSNSGQSQNDEPTKQEPPPSAAA